LISNNLVKIAFYTRIRSSSLFRSYLLIVTRDVNYLLLRLIRLAAGRNPGSL
jgi:hypothetical protein